MRELFDAIFQLAARRRRLELLPNDAPAEKRHTRLVLALPRQMRFEKIHQALVVAR